MALKRYSRSEFAAAWVFGVGAVFAISVTQGAASSIGVCLLWMAACVVPLSLVMLAWHKGPLESRGAVIEIPPGHVSAQSYRR
jgi:hypothetical protein